MSMLTEKETEYGVKYAGEAVNADMEYINSEHFAGKFKDITPNEKVNQILLECSRKAIEHRNGTLYEDMYIINAVTGEIITKQLNSGIEKGIIYTGKMKSAIAKARAKGIPMIALHTHPEGYPPSVEDFNSAYNQGYILGVVVGHNGQVYIFKRPDEKIKNADAVHDNIALMYQAGADVDRAYRDIYKIYGIDYKIKGGTHHA
ncbi:MAG: hypothetical protein NC078_01170 [Ruminococcus sp.]|nr:hypothetical protein [Ruminococcus sp.]